RLEHVARGGHAQVVGDGQAGVPTLRAVVDDEAALGMHRAAGQHRRGAQRRVSAGNAHLREDLAQGVVGAPVDDHAHRAVGVVLAQQRHRALEVRIGQRRQRDQQLVGERSGLGGHGVILASAAAMRPTAATMAATPPAAGSTMPTDAPLARDERAFIVLLAVLQGGLMYLAQKGHASGWWPFAALSGRVCWYTLVLAVPTMMALSVVRLRDGRFWQQAAGAALVVGALAAWAARQATGGPGVQAGSVLAPFGASVAVGPFVALPWLQCRLAHGHWRAPYACLFGHAWQNTLTLALAALFTGICWLVLWLWGALFALVKIDFFRELFREDAFVYLATGAMAGLGVLIGRTQRRAVQVARRLLLAIFTGLLPLLAFIAVLFVASLPFTGLAPLWEMRSAASTLVAVVALLVAFT